MYSQTFSPNSSRTFVQAREINFYGAAIVNEDGIEVPITEEMVEQALMRACGSVGIVKNTVKEC